MKVELVSKSVLLGLLLVAATAYSAPTPQAAPAATQSDAPAAQKSTFTDSAGFGRDPFFPNSSRRKNTATPQKFSGGDVPNTIVLKGLSGTAQKRLAMINNYTMAAGEEAEIRAGGQIFRVQCVEIRERSVMLSVNGMEPKELKLRTGQ